MNGFGRLLRVNLFGESHGASLGAVVDGCPAGVPLREEDFEADLKRRRSGAKGTTPRQERDLPKLMSGVFKGRTTGAPLLVQFVNENTDSSAYDKLVRTPRPGHADWVAGVKFGGHQDHRGGGHFSARLTLPLVAAGVVAKRLIPEVRIEASLLEVGGQADIEKAVDAALAANDSVGGVVACRVEGLPPGLGEPFFDSVESLLAHAVFSIPAIKGIEFGAGFELARMRGSEANDELMDAAGRTRTNHAGGIHGGLSNGNPLVFRVAVKPTSSISRTQKTVDLQTGEQVELSVGGRHDACVALRVPVVLEAVTALVLADLMLLEGKVPRTWK